MIRDFGDGKCDLIYILAGVVLQQLDRDPARKCVFSHRAQASRIRAIGTRIARYEGIIRARKRSALLEHVIKIDRPSACNQLGLGADAFAAQGGCKLLGVASEPLKIQFEQEQKIRVPRARANSLKRDALELGEVIGKARARLPTLVSELGQPFELRKSDGALH